MKRFRQQVPVRVVQPERFTRGRLHKAENYGRAISFFVNLNHATGESQHLRHTERLAHEAIGKLYVNGLFKGHAAKPYYQAADDVGILLHALMELDAVPQLWRPAF